MLIGAGALNRVFMVYFAQSVNSRIIQSFQQWYVRKIKLTMTKTVLASELICVLEYFFLDKNNLVTHDPAS